MAFFIPFVFLLGALCSLPFTLFYSLANWDNIFFMSLLKNTLAMYFGILGCAWIVPKSCSLKGLKILMAVLLGFALALICIGLFSLDKNSPSIWEYIGEIIGIILGFFTATLWKKNGMRVLLNKVEGANPFNAHSKSLENL